MARVERDIIPYGIDRITHQVHTDESAADTALTLSTPLRVYRKIVKVMVKYSANVTQNVTITLNSGEGASWDHVLKTLVISNARDAVWEPDSDTVLAVDDALDVLAPAGGGVITAAISIFSEIVE